MTTNNAKAILGIWGSEVRDQAMEAQGTQPGRVPRGTRAREGFLVEPGCAQPLSKPPILWNPVRNPYRQAELGKTYFFRIGFAWWANS